MARPFIVAVVVGLCVSAPASADSFDVPGDFAVIQEALDSPLTGDGDEIVLQDAVYSGPGNVAVDFAGQAITLRSVSGIAADCVIDCGGSDRGFIFQGAETSATRVEGLTIRFGHAASGGAVLCTNGSAPTFERCVFSQNEAAFDGGAVYSVAADPTFIQCSFVGNLAGRAGGGLWLLSGSAVVTECIFLENRAEGQPLSTGGGMYAAGSAPAVTDCTFEANRAGLSGGGMYNVDSGAVVIDCLFIANVSGTGGGMANANSSTRATGCTFLENEATGGGMYNANSAVIIEDCVFSDNVAGIDGGAGMCNFDSDASLLNCLFSGNMSENTGGGMVNTNGSELDILLCTFADNIAFEGGGAIFNSATSGGSVMNSIVWGNTVPPIIESGGVMTVDWSDVQAGWTGSGGNNIDADPAFVDPVSGDYRLAAGSPCIDAADNTVIPAAVETDLAGHPRFVDDPYTQDTGQGDAPLADLGPYESQTCLGDIDGDGQVGFTDLVELLSTWGPCKGCPGDVDGSGVVGFPDLLIVISSWGDCG